MSASLIGRVLVGSGIMPERKLNIVKRTPIALAFCEACNMEFHSLRRVEEEAEEEMRGFFAEHICRAGGSNERNSP